MMAGRGLVTSNSKFVALLEQGPLLSCITGRGWLAISSGRNAGAYWLVLKSHCSYIELTHRSIYLTHRIQESHQKLVCLKADRFSMHKGPPCSACSAFMPQAPTAVCRVVC